MLIALSLVAACCLLPALPNRGSSSLCHDHGEVIERIRQRTREIVASGEATRRYPEETADEYRFRVQGFCRMCLELGVDARPLFCNTRCATCDEVRRKFSHSGEQP
jgi:hypothetical protein